MKNVAFMINTTGNTSANCHKNMYLPILHLSSVELGCKLQKLQVALCNTASTATYSGKI